MPGLEEGGQGGEERRSISSHSFSSLFFMEARDGRQRVANASQMPDVIILMYTKQVRGGSRSEIRTICPLKVREPLPPQHAFMRVHQAY